MAKRTCSIDGCELGHQAKGWCINHYRRWRKYGDPLGEFPTPVERLHSRYVVDCVTGCMIWTGAKSDTGYGQLGVGGKVVYVHRWSYEHFVGPIPDGLVIDHLCRTRSCCNPDHLRPCTDRENLLADGSLSPCATNAAKTHCVNGHRFDESNTYLRHDKYARQCRACSNQRRRV